MIVFPVIILAIKDDEDRQFMQRLYEDHYRLMYAKAFEVLGDHQDVEDIVHQIIIALIDKLPLIRTLECYVLRAYVVSSIKHAALNRLRSQTRRNQRMFLDDGTALNQIADDQEDVEFDLIRREEIERVKTGIKKLKESDKQVLDMKYVLDMSNAEIAAELGISVDSVRPHLQRIRKRAYAALAEDGR